MGRRKKLNIDLNNIDTLQELMQEVYHDACNQIKEAQNHITNLNAGAQPMDTDEVTKLSKSKTDLLKVKEGAIKIKPEVAKVQKEVITKKAEVQSTTLDGVEGRISNPAEVSLADFSRLRKMVDDDNKNGDD